MKFICLSILLLAPVVIHAQEQPARTWAGFGATLIKSTAGPVTAGTDVRLAYDLRHGFQIRAGGEYRKAPTIERLFTAYQDLEAESELRYEGSLVYHLPVERRIRPFVGGGVFVARHSFDDTPQRPGTSLYNSSVNPYIVAGAAIGRRNEISVTRYLADTYSYSKLRGWGVDYVRIEKLSGRLHLRSGVKVKFWSFQQGHEAKRPSEAAIVVGLHFQ